MESNVRYEIRNEKSGRQAHTKAMNRIASLCLCSWLACAAILAATVEKTPRELIEYIQDAQKLGLKEGEIRQNAVNAGFDKIKVNEAIAIVNYLSANSKPTSDKAMEGTKPVAIGEGYRIGAGDVLQIVVWRETEASVPSVVVRADGKISVPLIREVEAAGMTPAELEASLTTKFGRLIRGADVTVIIKEVNSQKVYLVGAVKKEGPVPLQSSMTVLQAINAGGGLNDFAKKKKIYILRSENGKQLRLPFDYQAVIKGERAEQNVAVRPDDTIVVPQ